MTLGTSAPAVNGASGSGHITICLEAPSKDADGVEKLNKQFEDPSEFCCPISHLLMEDPVVAEDGNSYDRQCIMKHLQSSKKSPLTNSNMKGGVFENRNLRHSIAAYKENFVRRVLDNVSVFVNMGQQKDATRILQRAHGFVNQFDKQLSGRYHEQLLLISVELLNDNSRRVELVQLWIDLERYQDLVQRSGELSFMQAMPELGLQELSRLFHGTSEHRDFQVIVGKELLNRLLTSMRNLFAKSGQTCKIAQKFMERCPRIPLDDLIVENNLCTLLVTGYQLLDVSGMLHALHVRLLRGMLRMMTDEHGNGELACNLSSLLKKQEANIKELLERLRSSETAGNDGEGEKRQKKDNAGRDGETKKKKDNAGKDDELMKALSISAFNSSSICAVACEIASKLSDDACNLEEKVRLFSQALKFDPSSERAKKGKCAAAFELFRNSKTQDSCTCRELYELHVDMGAIDELAAFVFDMMAHLPNEVFTKTAVGTLTKLANGVHAHGKQREAGALIVHAALQVEGVDPVKAVLLYDQAIRYDPDNKDAQEKLLSFSAKNKDTLKQTLALALQQAAQPRIGNESELSDTAKWVIRVVESFITSEVQAGIAQAAAKLQEQTDEKLKQVEDRKLAFDAKIAEADELRKQWADSLTANTRLQKNMEEQREASEEAMKNMQIKVEESEIRLERKLDTLSGNIESSQEKRSKLLHQLADVTY